MFARRLLPLLFAVACVPDPAIAPAPPPPPPVDAGQVAPPPVDAGVRLDAAPVLDAEPLDARAPPDASAPDAGFVDAGHVGYPRAYGPANGTVIVHGGGGTARGREGLFFDFVGNADAPVIVVPTAQGSVDLASARAQLTNVGFRNVTVLHTRDPAVADTATFVAPLATAEGVWFSGGRQWRLADAYLETRFMPALAGVLERGGVIGGTSAGASIMGSFLFRGDTSGNEVLIGDHVVGFGFLDHVGVDQHVAQRGRQTDLFALVELHPDHLGVGMDEPIAAVFSGDAFEVFGTGLAYVHYRGLWDSAQTTQDRYLRLSPGAVFDLATLTVAR